MKLTELKTLQPIQESFVPVEFEMALDKLRNGEEFNISHKLILAQVVNFIKDHPVTPERFRNIWEFRPSLEMVEAIKAMSDKEISELAEWAYEVIDNAKKNIDLDTYVNPQQGVLDYIRWVTQRQN